MRDRNLSLLYVVFALVMIVTCWHLSAQEVIRFGRFGQVSLYADKSQPAHVVLFISGDGGWNKGVVDMARAMTGMDALVAGIDITHYLKELAHGSEACSYPAADFEMLSKYIQKLREFPDYVQPLLVGYSSGATLVYALLAQAPPGTFAGAVSLGFCPDLPLKKPLCKGYGLEWQAGPRGKGVVFLPLRRLATPWIVLQGWIDQVCDAASTRAYVNSVEQAEIVMLEHVGHGFSMQKNWLPQFQQACRKIFTPPPPPRSRRKQFRLRLPTCRWSRYCRKSGKKIIWPWWCPVTAAGRPLTAASATPWPPAASGWWASIHSNIFGKSALPKRRAATCSASWTITWPPGKKAGRPGGLLPGGRCPAFHDQWPESHRRGRRSAWSPCWSQPGGGLRVSPQRLAGEFFPSQFQAGQARGGKTARPAHPVFFGEDESDSLCHDLEPALARCIPLGGGHHFGGDYQSIATAIMDACK